MQISFLLDECVQSGKGATGVISQLHSLLECYLIGVETHTPSC